MADGGKITLMTMCLVLDGDKVLLIERLPEKGFPRYIGAGGKVDFSKKAHLKYINDGMACQDTLKESVRKL